MARSLGSPAPKRRISPEGRMTSQGTPVLSRRRDKPSPCPSPPPSLPGRGETGSETGIGAIGDGVPSRRSGVVMRSPPEPARFFPPLPGRGGVGLRSPPGAGAFFPPPPGEGGGGGEALARPRSTRVANQNPDRTAAG